MNHLADNVWEVSKPLRLGGLMELGHRMTVVRLISGELVVHSPVAWDAEVDRELRAIGDVRYFVAPSRFHDLFWETWWEKFPGARFYGAPGLQRKFDFMDVLAPGGKDPWGRELERIFVGGMPWVNENVFFHAPSGTLVVADFLFNINDGGPVISRTLLWCAGIYRGLRQSRFFRACIRDRAQYRVSVEAILQRDFGRLIVGHGEVVETGAKAAVQGLKLG